MATNWSIQTSSKASTTDNFTVEAFTKSYGVVTRNWEHKLINWEDMLHFWSPLCTISGKATAGDSD